MAAPQTRRERQEQTRAKLLTAAARVFARRGYHAATVPEIAAEAGVSTGAIYSNFEGKEALFHALMSDEMRRQHEVRTLNVDGIATIQGALETSGRQWADYVDRHRDSVLLLIEFCLSAARDTSDRTRVAEELQTVRERLAALFGEVAKATDRQARVPLDRFASAVQALSYGYALQHLVDPGSVTPEDLALGLAWLSEAAEIEH